MLCSICSSFPRICLVPSSFEQGMVGAVLHLELAPPPCRSPLPASLLSNAWYLMHLIKCLVIVPSAGHDGHCAEPGPQ